MTTYTEMWDKIENKYRRTYGPYMEAYKQSVNMKELFLIGRAGYGLWQGGELLTGALIANGMYGKVIFNMPGERRNSPTRSYIRYADEEVPFPAADIYKSDHMIVVDGSLLNFVSQAFDIDIPSQIAKMDENGLVLINSSKSPKQIKAKTQARIATVNAAQIAIDYLGNPFHCNTALIGAYIAATGVITLDAFEKAIFDYKDPRERNVYAGKKGQMNMKAARAGYESIKM